MRTVVPPTCQNRASNLNKLHTDSITTKVVWDEDELSIATYSGPSGRSLRPLLASSMLSNESPSVMYWQHEQFIAYVHFGAFTAVFGA